MCSIAGPVLMFVYMDVASHIKSFPPGGMERCTSWSFKVNESLKNDCYVCTIGWSILVIHFPRPWLRLLTYEQTGHVGHLLFSIPL